MSGPLSSLKVVEMAGLGPAPFCAMYLADLGADVIRVARPGTEPNKFEVTHRNRPFLALDLRAPGAADTVLELVASADVLIEGFRPGVMERLGLGPDACLRRNPRLIYGRMTGWGQTGPLAAAAGHDLNYLAITGGLNAIGRANEAPVPPLNYVADFGGGAMMLVAGILAALFETRISGKGQVIDAAMTDGAALLSAMMYGFRGQGRISNQREDNMLDGGAHFYGTYACADGKYVAIGAIEPQFYARLRDICGIQDPLFDAQMDKTRWPMLKLRLADVFLMRTRDEWCALLEGTDACFAPVLDWDEAPRHAHNVARSTFVTVEGVIQPGAAPRFSRTGAALPAAAIAASDELMVATWGLSEHRLSELRDTGALAGRAEQGHHAVAVA